MPIPAACQTLHEHIENFRGERSLLREDLRHARRAKKRATGTWLRSRLALGALVTCCMGVAATADAQINVTSARIGCLDVEKSGNLTSLVESV
jgi:hypothetical protein